MLHLTPENKPEDRSGVVCIRFVYVLIYRFCLGMSLFCTAAYCAIATYIR